MKTAIQILQLELSTSRSVLEFTRNGGPGETKILKRIAELEESIAVLEKFQEENNCEVTIQLHEQPPFTKQS